MAAYVVKTKIDNNSLAKEIIRLGAAFNTQTAAVVAAIAVADANTQTGAYVQADVQSIRTLANQNKATVNAILVSLKAAGIMASS